jgi:naphthoate synthase/2-ketocyclohexanecarboxyl-CoA hydrolase
MEFTDIRYEKKDGVATITINRPERRNALRAKTYEEMTVAFEDAANDTEVGVVVLTGAGDKAFSAGGDVEGQAARTPDIARPHLRRVEKLSTVIRGCGKPVIAAVNGYAIGGGHELHLFCDITIAGDTARFGQVGPKVGSVPIWGATQLLPRIVGEKKAREILFLCKQYTAQEALEMGLVNKVVPADQLMKEVDAWCQELLDKSPQSLRIAKLALNMESDVSFHASFHAGAEMLSMVTGNAENMEGVTAFLEKRKPNYRKFRRGPGA